MRGHPARRHVKPERALVPDQRVIRRRLADHQRADCAQQLALLDEMRRTPAPQLFIGSDHQRDPGPVLQLVRHAQRRDHEGRDAAFHIARTAAVEFAAFEARAKCVCFPRGGAQRHGVDMAGETERRLAFGAADFSDQAGARRREFRVIDRKSRALQQVAQMLRARLLGAGRINGVELEELARELQHVRNFRHKTISVTDGFSGYPGARTHGERKFKPKSP